MAIVQDGACGADAAAMVGGSVSCGFGREAGGWEGRSRITATTRMITPKIAATIR